MDTIFAPITATISGAIITIRISGDKATNIIDFFALKLTKLTPRYVYLQELKYQGEIIDQVLLTYFLHHIAILEKMLSKFLYMLVKQYIVKSLSYYHKYQVFVMQKRVNLVKEHF